MCGITGFWQPPRDAADVLQAIAGRMTDTIVHRGPDDAGVWVDAAAGVALGFRRLSIIDLSPLGHQPMQSVEQRYTVVYNGEIYNYRDLRAELQSRGHSFRGSSDTEVMLAGFSAWGIEATLKRIAGMFGIAVWDAETQALTLARDRVGKKPVYFGRAGDAWVFGSELKTIRAFPRFQPEIDRDALLQFLRHTYVPAPRSIYRGIHKLLPGHFVRLTRNADAVLTCYWDAAAMARDGQAHPHQLTDADAVDQLDALLRDAVGRRMVADVPLGAFLSGGLDSSTIVALMQAQSASPVKTFTIGFEVAGYNEAEAAKAVAAHLHTDHTELYVSAEQTMAVIPKLASIYDEPFADSSQIPTYLVSQLARSQVTVSLSGDGGDELFTGYNRYFWAPGIWNRAKYLPARVRAAMCSAVEHISPQTLDRAYALAEPALPQSWRVRLAGDKVHKLAAVMRASDPMDLYRRLTSAWQQPESVVVGGTEPAALTDRPYLPDGFCERMMFVDLLTYLADDILVKVDRASMAVSLEARAPLLDHRVVEWAWRLPHHQRVRGGAAKWLLRQVLYRYVPKALVERPKMGFGVPVDHWVRGPLREWAEDLLSASALEAGGYLRAAPIRAVWDGHLRGHRNDIARLWPILMFQDWRRRWMP